MNENAAKWVRALREGGYDQDMERLRRGNGGFCCLGVACDVYMKETGEGEWKTGISGMIFVVGHEKSGSELPVGVMKWLGMASTYGRYEYEEHPRDLVYHNDVEGWGFSRIADLIESEPKEMFGKPKAKTLEGVPE